MLSLDGTPSTWELILDLYPVFLAPQNFPDTTGATDATAQRLGEAICDLKNQLALTQTKHKSIQISHRDPNVAAVRDLNSAVEQLADVLEELIEPGKGKPDSRHGLAIGSVTPPSYPKLNLLRTVFLDNKPPPDDTSDTLQHTDDRNNTSSAGINKSSASTTSTREMEARVAGAARLIGFPQELPGITLLKRAFTRFASEIGKASFGESVQESAFTDKECELINQAYKCSSVSSLLFFHLARETTCDTLHQAKLDLSGARRGQLKMMVRKCQDTTSERWLSAIFTHSPMKPPPGVSAINNICSSTENPEPLRVLYDSDTMWASSEDNGSSALTVPPTEKSLQDFLNREPPAEPALPKLELNSRSLVGFFLAATFFQLCGSPWLKEPFQAESISLSVTNNQPLDQWHLHTPCDLVPSTEVIDLTDSVAALGVLVLELETENKALWAPTDERSRTGSHRRRLRRLLREWKGDIIGENKRIAHSCLDFETLLESFEDPNISLGKKMPAFIYRHILEPIVRRNAERFEELRNVSTAIFGPCGTLSPLHNIILPEPLGFFDAEDQLLCEDTEGRSKKFFTEADTFLHRLMKIRHDFNSLNAEGKGKKRIVLLDTGTDVGQPFMFHPIGQGRINRKESKSFVGSPWYQDDDMHGTNIAELAMRAAPTAEIIIGKICERRNNTYGMVDRLAEAINWATKEKKADIICLSLGYRTAHDAADTAVDNAIKAGVLVVAAASNHGTRKPRMRPACLDGVICMHAANANGCISDMNPGRLENETNFSTLGVGVPVFWKGKYQLKAGTSYAAPIAAGFIASMLDFIEAKIPGLSGLQVEKLKRKKGIEAILKKISTRDRYQFDFINPGDVCNWKEADAVQKLVDMVKEALRDV